jgi:membrane fusion protein (multidrug efflux system)
MFEKIKTFSLSAVILGLLLVVLVGCIPGAPSKDADAVGKSTERRAQDQPGSRDRPGVPGSGGNVSDFGVSGETAIAVNTIEAFLAPITKTLKIGGEVVARESVDIFADIAGTVTSVLVELGDNVSKGQVLAKVDPSKPGMEYTESPVKATISGTVTSVPVRVGKTISTATPVATIGRLDALEVETYIPERFIGKIRVGTRALLSFAAWPDKSFSARVVKLSPVVDPESRTMEAKLAIDHPDGRVKAGLYATVELITEQKNGVIALPSDCVVTRDGRTVVYVVDQDRAVEREVSLGISAKGMVEITDGITVGEEVVVSGQSLLSDGISVRIVERGKAGGDV